MGNSKKKKYQLLLKDDDVNTFEEVIECLMEVLGHNMYQAEQCAMLVHYKGECIVQHGTLDDLELYKEMMDKSNLNVELEEIK